MKISCLLVSHDKIGLVDEAIRSVLTQSHNDFELIAIDSGILFDKHYFRQYQKDPRVKVIRSAETAAIRKEVAIASWCFNKLIHMVDKRNLVLYLCDDDIFYPHAFATFNAYMERNPDCLACYSAQDFGSYDERKIENPLVFSGVRHAYTYRGRNVARLDCQVDYLQLCHRAKLWDLIPKEEFWPQDLRHKSHLDGLLLEKIGSRTLLHPVPFKTGMNRRTRKSDNIPLK